MKRNSVAAIILFLILPSAALNSKQAGESDRIDVLIRARMKERNIPGLSLVVIKEGKVVKQQAYGLANVELNVPVTNDTVFQIASTTKVFTGVAIMMLVEEGKLALNDKVTDLLPGLPAQWNEVTIRHIMTHTSGLPDVLEVTGQTTGKDFPGTTHQDIVSWVAQKPIESKPSEKWSYIQTGYLLANMIIQAKTGKTWEEFAQERFFKPLGMASTSFGDQRELIHNRASYYENHPKAGNRPYHLMVYDPRMNTAAGLNTTPGDLAKWLIALQTGRLLRPSSLAVLWTPVKLNDGQEFRMNAGRVGYGKGWLIIDFSSNHRAVGGEGGTTNAFLYFPKDALTVIAMTNKVRSDDLPIVIHVARLYLPGLQ